MAAVIVSTHFDASGANATAASETGFIGFATCNCGARVVPFDGQKQIHGTNPIALAAPAADRDPVLLDILTSATPWNNVMRSRSECIACFPEPLSLALQKSWAACRRGCGYRRNGTVCISRAMFENKIAAYLGGFDQPPYATPAGGPQWKARNERLSHCISLPEGLTRELQATAEKTGVAFNP